MAMMIYAWVPLQEMLEQMEWIVIPAESKVRTTFQLTLLNNHGLNVLILTHFLCPHHTAQSAGNCRKCSGALLARAGRAWYVQKLSYQLNKEN